MFYAEKVFINGNIITMNPAQPRAEAVAVFGDRIIAVGSNSDMQTIINADTKVINLEGKTMIPGLNEGHAHLLQFGLDSLNLDVGPEQCPNLHVMKKKIAERAATLEPGVWIQGWGWDEVRMEEGRAPSVEDLTEAAPNNPVILIRTCYHMVAVNQMALDMAGITDNTPDPEGGKIVRGANGKATGLLQDTAQDYVRAVIPPPGKDQLKKAMAQAAKIYNSQGITSTTDAGMLTEVRDEIPAWCEASKEGLLTVRTTTLMLSDIVSKVRELGLPSNFGNDMLKFGCAKFFMDGSVGGGTAGMTKPYLKSEYGTGLIYMEQEELSSKIKDVHDAGYQISVHGIGDRTLDIILTAFEEALAANPRENHRHRIEHFSMSYPHLLDRAKKLGLTINMNPGFLYFLGDSHIINIGDEVNYEFAMKTAIDKGIVVSAGSDRPVINGHPKYTLYSMVQRDTISGKDCGKSECITMEQALYAYTMAGAYQTFDENKKGSIEPGKLADFAVLSLAPTDVAPHDILNMEVLMTVLGGEIVFSV
jgi:predicted amidohydrolase YtcJ